MAYLGNRPAESFASFEKQVFTIVNSQTAYTLSHSVTNENDIRLVVNSVVQEPGSGKAYTASGTTLTLSAALTNGTDTMYCVFLGRALQTVNAPNASVGSDQTAPTIITGQTAETSIATDDTILIHDTSASALRKMTRANFVSGVGGVNTPYAHIKLSANQNTSNASNVKVTLDSVELDSASGFDATNDRWVVPSGQAGKYFITCAVNCFSSSSSHDFTYARLYINGSKIAEASTLHRANDGEGATENITVIKNLSVGDYIELYGQGEGGGNPSYFQGDSTISYTYLNLFKIIE